MSCRLAIAAHPLSQETALYCFCGWVRVTWRPKAGGRAQDSADDPHTLCWQHPGWRLHGFEAPGIVNG